MAAESFGGGRDLGLVFLLVSILSIVVGGTLSLFLSVLVRWRNAALSALVAGATATPLLLAGFPLVSGARELALERLVRRSEPVVAALRAFEARNGLPPPSLDALVPEFLPSIPATGIPDASSYAYEFEPASDNSPPSWRLGIKLGGIFDFDELVLTSDGKPWLFNEFSDTRIGEWMLIDRF
ncbi:MAG: hypothetical protein NTV21_14695 [Planctomycetota bacterium]|nr:hypothetical protein [Planctomycetota bacterium]